MFSTKKKWKRTLWLAIPEEQSPEDGKRRCQKGGEDAISPQFGLQNLSINVDSLVWRI